MKFHDARNISFSPSVIRGSTPPAKIPCIDFSERISAFVISEKTSSAVCLIMSIFSITNCDITPYAALIPSTTALNTATTVFLRVSNTSLSRRRLTPKDTDATISVPIKLKNVVANFRKED